MLCRQRDRLIGILLRSRSLAAKLMTHRGKRQRVRQTVGLRTMSRKRYSFLNRHECPIGLADEPTRPADKAKASHGDAGVQCIDQHIAVLSIALE